MRGGPLSMQHGRPHPLEKEPMAYKRFLPRNWPLEKSHSWQSAGWKPRAASGNVKGQSCKLWWKVRETHSQSRSGENRPAPDLCFFLSSASARIWDNARCIGQGTLFSSVSIQMLTLSRNPWKTYPDRYKPHQVSRYQWSRFHRKLAVTVAKC